MLTWGEIGELVYWGAWACVWVYGAITVPVIGLWLIAAWQTRERFPEVWSWRALVGSLWWVASSPIAAWGSLLGKEERE